MRGLIAYVAIFRAHIHTDFMPIDIFRLFVAHGELAEVVNAEAERSGFEGYPSHGFLLAMLDGAMDRLVKVADKGWLYRLHGDDD